LMLSSGYQVLNMWSVFFELLIANFEEPH